MTLPASWFASAKSEAAIVRREGCSLDKGERGLWRSVIAGQGAGEQLPVLPLGAAFRKNADGVSLRGEPIEMTATLPDGRSVRVWIGVPDDSYIARRQLDTVDIELSLVDGNHLAAVNTVLDAEQTSEARALAREIVAGLESGKLEPTAAALEPLADQPR